MQFETSEKLFRAKPLAKPSLWEKARRFCYRLFLRLGPILRLLKRRHRRKFERILRCFLESYFNRFFQLRVFSRHHASRIVIHPNVRIAAMVFDKPFAGLSIKAGVRLFYFSVVNRNLRVLDSDQVRPTMLLLRSSQVFSL